MIFISVYIDDDMHYLVSFVDETLIPTNYICSSLGGALSAIVNYIGDDDE